MLHDHFGPTESEREEFEAMAEAARMREVRIAALNAAVRTEGVTMNNFTPTENARTRVLAVEEIYVKFIETGERSA